MAGESSKSAKMIFTDNEEGKHQCAICLQDALYPTILPCGHVFCYLCVKGSAVVGSGLCALCREYIPDEALYKPKLMEDKLPHADPTSVQWYYEGRNGWWQYDERSNELIENSFNGGENTMEMAICGKTYTIDFATNYQFQKSDPRRRRRIVRSPNSNLLVKGIAGLDLNEVNDNPSHQ